MLPKYIFCIFFVVLIILDVEAVNNNDIGFSSLNDSNISIISNINSDLVINNSNATLNNQSPGIENILKTFLSDSSNLLNYIIQNILSIFFIVLIVLLFFWLRRDEDMLIMPFEVSESEKKISGKAISDLLLSELQRISQISNKEYEGIKPEKLILPTMIQVTSENTSIPQLGTISMGPASVSIGEMMVTLKNLCRGSNHGPLISGSLQRYGSDVRGF